MVISIPIKKLAPWPGLNPRKRFDPEKLAELVESVREKGVLQPLVVHDRGLNCQDLERWWIVAGERRWRAAKEAGVEEILCNVGTFTDAEAIQIALIENLQRADMTVVEEARGYQRALDSGLSQKDLAQKLGLSQPTVSNRLRLLQLPDPVLQLIEDGLLEVSHARDHLLPFARIPEGVRGRLYGEIAKQLHAADGKPPAGADVRRMVADKAVRLSRPIRREEVAHGIDQQVPAFDPQDHQGCRCQGPRFAYRDWGGDHARCFDFEWWDAAQAAARAKRDEEIETARRAADAQGRGEGLRVLDEREFSRAYRHDEYEVIVNYGGRATLLDPDLLPRESLVVVGHGPGPRLVCTDREAVKKARVAVEREKTRRVKEKKAQLMAEDVARADTHMFIESWMLAEILTHRPYRDAIMYVARDLGHEMKHGEVDDALKKMAMEDLHRLFKVLAIRCRDGRVGYGDTVERAVEEDLAREFGPRIHALMPAPTVDPDLQRRLQKVFEAFRSAYAAVEVRPADELTPVRLAAAVRAYMRVDHLLQDHPDLELDKEQDHLFGNAEWLLSQEPYINDPETDAVCIHCGCTDSAACPEGCAWVVVDREKGLGVCSSCGDDRATAEEEIANAA